MKYFLCKEESTCSSIFGCSKSRYLIRQEAPDGPVLYSFEEESSFWSRCCLFSYGRVLILKMYDEEGIRMATAYKPFSMSGIEPRCCYGRPEMMVSDSSGTIIGNIRAPQPSFLICQKRVDIHQSKEGKPHWTLATPKKQGVKKCLLSSCCYSESKLEVVETHTGLKVSEVQLQEGRGRGFCFSCCCGEPSFRYEFKFPDSLD